MCLWQWKPSQSSRIAQTAALRRCPEQSPNTPPSALRANYFCDSSLSPTCSLRSVLGPLLPQHYLQVSWVLESSFSLTSHAVPGEYWSHCSHQNYRQFQVSIWVIVLTNITCSSRWVLELSFSPTLHAVPGEYLSHRSHQHYMQFQVSTWAMIVTIQFQVRLRAWVIILTNCSFRWVLEPSFSPTIHAVLWSSFSSTYSSRWAMMMMMIPRRWRSLGRLMVTYGHLSTAFITCKWVQVSVYKEDDCFPYQWDTYCVPELWPLPKKHDSPGTLLGEEDGQRQAKHCQAGWAIYTWWDCELLHPSSPPRFCWSSSTHSLSLFLLLSLTSPSWLTGHEEPATY